jgi:hypothetical protein
MAQVLAPIVQTSGSITMLHTSAEAFQNSPSQSHHQPSRSSQMPRNHVYNTQSGGIGYRGTSSAPIAPYAFSSTPQLRQENRSSSAPGNPYAQQNFQPNNAAKHGHPSHPSSSSDSTVSTSSSSNRSSAGQPFVSKDDTAILSNLRSLPIRLNEDSTRRSIMDTQSVSAVSISTSVPDFALPSFDSPVKPSPDRYRRGPRRMDSNNNGSPAAQTPTNTQGLQLANTLVPLPGSRLANVPPFNNAISDAKNRPSHNRANSADDMQLPRQVASDQAKRYRRRSLGSFEANAQAYHAATMASTPSAPIGSAPPKRPAVQETNPQILSNRPVSNHERHGSGGSASSNSTATKPSSVSPLLENTCRSSVFYL